MTRTNTTKARAQAVIATLRGRGVTFAEERDTPDVVPPRECAERAARATAAVGQALALALVAADAGVDGIDTPADLINAWRDAEQHLEAAIVGIGTHVRGDPRPSRPALPTLAQLPSDLSRYALLDVRLSLCSSRWSLRSAMVAACAALRIPEPPGLRARQ